MQSPSTLSDLPEPSSGSRRMTVLAVVVWSLLAVGIGALVVYSYRGMVDLSRVGTVYSAVAVVVVTLIAIPILRRLLAISRLLATVAFFIKLGVVLRFIVL